MVGVVDIAGQFGALRRNPFTYHFSSTEIVFRFYIGIAPAAAQRLATIKKQFAGLLIKWCEKRMEILRKTLAVRPVGELDAGFIGGVAVGHPVLLLPTKIGEELLEKWRRAFAYPNGTNLRRFY